MNTTLTHTHQPRPWLRRAAFGLAWVAVMLAVFALYARPDFLKTLADQLWACF